LQRKHNDDAKKAFLCTKTAIHSTNSAALQVLLLLLLLLLLLSVKLMMKSLSLKW
jgi:hypothetical protein